MHYLGIAVYRYQIPLPSVAQVEVKSIFFCGAGSLANAFENGYFALATGFFSSELIITGGCCFPFGRELYIFCKSNISFCAGACIVILSKKRKYIFMHEVIVRSRKAATGCSYPVKNKEIYSSVILMLLIYTLHRQRYWWYSSRKCLNRVIWHTAIWYRRHHRSF